MLVRRRVELACLDDEERPHAKHVNVNMIAVLCRSRGGTGV